MQDLINATKQTFGSSCYKTPHYIAWHRLFKKEFTKFLKDKDVTEIQIGRPNHFDISGFFKTKHDLIFYFSIPDLRGNKDKMLIRTAENFKDYTGGRNNFASLDNLETFTRDFNNITN